MKGISKDLQVLPSAVPRRGARLRRCGFIHSREGGGAAIEFAFVFPVFFFLFYGLVTWGLIFLVQHAMTLAAQDAARAAVAVDIDAFFVGGSFDEDAYAAAVENRVRTAVSEGLDWLPTDWKEHILGAGNSNVSAPITQSGTVYVVTVTLEYRNYPSNPILPLVELPGLGPVPPVPDELMAEAVAQL